MSAPAFTYETHGDVSTPWAMGHIVVRHVASGQSCTLTRRPVLPKDGPLYKSTQRTTPRNTA